jgi:4-hydroxy-2-oxoheptanedioate aldolase
VEVPSRTGGSGIIRAMVNQMTDDESIPPRPDLRRRVLAGDTTVGAFANLGSLASTELLARTGFDWLVVDLEHGMGTEADLYPQLLAVQATPTAAIVRVASAERLRVGRALDAGADGLMIPRLERHAEVVETLSWMRYPPVGMRGVATLTRGAGFTAIAHADLAATVNEHVLGVFQVESTDAVEAADMVAGTDGVDVLFVGPADLSHAMGIPGQIEAPAFLAALDRVVAACRTHGKAAGILLRDASTVAAAVAQGFSFIGVGSDTGFVLAGARAAVAQARAAVA